MSSRLDCANSVLYTAHRLSALSVCGASKIHSLYAANIPNLIGRSSTTSLDFCTRSCVLADRHILQNFSILMFLSLHCEHSPPRICALLALTRTLIGSLIPYCSSNDLEFSAFLHLFIPKSQTLDLSRKRVKNRLF